MTRYRCAYIEAHGFVAVLTPHFQEQCVNRASLLKGTEPLGPSHYLAIYQAAPADTTVGFIWGRGYIYARKKFNSRRRRWELEFISYTPTANFHTRNRTFAVRINPSF